MKKFNLPKDAILTKKELTSFYGGAFICTCLNEDGSRTILPGDASSPEECAEMCRQYWEKTRPSQENQH